MKEKHYFHSTAPHCPTQPLTNIFTQSNIQSSTFLRKLNQINQIKIVQFNVQCLFKNFSTINIFIPSNILIQNAITRIQVSDSVKRRGWSQQSLYSRLKMDHEIKPNDSFPPEMKTIWNLSYRAV